ncbi:hypothetical protein D3C72_2289020 [compost metagenome]
MGLQGVNDFSMFALGGIAPDILHVDPADKPDAFVQADQHPLEFGVARHGGDAQVKTFVQFHQLRDRGICGHRLAVLEVSRKLLDALGRGPLERQAQAIALDRYACFV